MKCKQCGTENKSDALICSNCGYVLDSDDVMFSKNEQTINAEASHKQSQIDEIKRRRDKKRKQKKIKKIILIALIVLIAAGAIYGAFYLSEQQDIKINNNDIQQAEQTPTPTETASPEQTLMPTPEVTPTASPEATPTPLVSEEANSQTVAEATKAPVKATQKPTQKPAKATQKATAKPVSTPKPTPKPVVNPKIADTMLILGETVTDEQGNNYISAQTSGKTVYLQATDSIENNSYAKVFATDTGATYNNAPVYTVTSAVKIEKTEFILPDSSLKILTQEDISGLSKEQLKIARNEIYARHGRTFKDEALNSYFKDKSWYKINPSYKYNNDELNISEIENKNAHFLLDIERGLQ